MLSRNKWYDSICTDIFYIIRKNFLLDKFVKE